MKVYLLTESEQDHYEVHGVFSTEDKAHQYMVNHPEQYSPSQKYENLWVTSWGWMEIEEHQVDDPPA